MLNRVQDPYEVMSVPRDADLATIKKAYRRLARELHPDLHPGDKAKDLRFREVNAAFEILRDPGTRKRFDAGEIDAAGHEIPQRTFWGEHAAGDDASKYYRHHGDGDDVDLGDLFGGLFGRGGGPTAGGRTVRFPGQDARYALTVGLLDAARGATTEIRLPTGQGLSVRIPAGLDDGEVLRLRGQGHPGVGGGPPGDALVTVHVEPHPRFVRRGLDIELALPVSLREAVLGGGVPVPTIHGEATLQIPKATGGDVTLRMRGQGVHEARTGKRGDQLVRLRVVLPAHPAPELEALVAEWAKTHDYDPRAAPEGAA